MSFKVLSVNARGLGNSNKRRSMFRLFKKDHYDFICIQEAHITQKNVHAFQKQWGGDLFYSTGSSHGKGQVILINKKVCPSNVNIICQNERILGLKVSTEHNDLIIYNVYGPSNENDRKLFFSNLCDNYNEHSTQGCMSIIAGDFDTVASNRDDLIAGNPHKECSIELFNESMAQLDLYDAWRLFHADEKQYTWCRHNPDFIARRLDYIFCSSALFDKVSFCDIVAIPGTDHRGVTLEVQSGGATKGSSYWKFNDHLLHDIEYVQMIN